MTADESPVPFVSHVSRGPLCRLVDMSRSLVEPLDGGDIQAASVRRNSLLGLTGARTFDEGRFAQALDRILRDERHKKARGLDEGWIEARDFSQWAMA